MSMISVVMPVYNGEKHLKEAIESIIGQTYPDWEMLIINEKDSLDRSPEIAQSFAKRENRIIFIQNDVKLGLAESLNKGIHLAKGKYIARMDADDRSHPARFEKQIRLLENNSEIGLCGTYQHHFGPGMNWIHKPPISPDECRANLLFDCDVCHSTVMFSRKLFMQNGLFYDKNYHAEDFELWTRAITVTKFSTIPEVLGEYRWEGDNITVRKKKELARENAVIVANSLRRNLGMEVPNEKYGLLEGWGNPFRAVKDKKTRQSMYLDFQRLLTEIYEQNQKVKFYEDKALLSILAAKWRYVRYLEPRNEKRTVNSLEEIFDPHYRPDYIMMWKSYCARRSSFRYDLKKIVNYVKSRS